MVTHTQKTPGRRAALAKWLDVLVFLAVLAFAFLFLMHSDLLEMSMTSLNFLDGHFSDFYDISGAAASDLPTVYLLLALWSAPLRLIGMLGEIQSIEHFSLIARLWIELLPVLFSFLSLLVFRRVCSQAGMTLDNARKAAFFWLSSPILFFAVYIYAGYEIIALFFILLGILYWQKDSQLLSALFFGIAVTINFFALPLFILCLVMKPQKFARLLLQLLIFCLPFALECLPYLGNSGFQTYLIDFWRSQLPFSSAIGNGAVSISLLVLGLGVVICAAVFTQPRDEAERFRYLICYSCWICFLLFGICVWPTHYLVLCTPFWALTIYLNRDSEFLSLLDIVFMLFICIFTVTVWENSVDQTMFNNGILKRLLLTHPFDKLTMAGIMEKTTRSMCFSIMSAIMLVFAAVSHPRFLTPETAPGAERSGIYARLRFVGGTACFLVPACIVLFVALRGPMLSPIGSLSGDIGPLTSERMVSEVFTAQRDQLRKIEIEFALDDSAAAADVRLDLVELESGTQLFETLIDGSDLRDGKRYEIETGRLDLQKGQRYAINLSAEEQGDPVSIYYYLGKEMEDENGHLTNVDDQYQLYDLAIWLYGD